MLPMPTRAAGAVFAGCVVALAIGIGALSVPATLIGTSGLVGLGLALAASMPLGRRMRRQRLEFAWWLEHGDRGGGGAVVPTSPFRVRCYVRHRQAGPLLATRLRPVLPHGVRLTRERPHALVLRPRARTEFAFELAAPAAGRVVLQGLALAVRGPLGLFEVPLYFPNPLAVRVLPQAAARRRSRAASTGALAERSGGPLLRRRGGGTELYELRELQSGDPFNAIAWKASARFGRLMVKEVEREVQETRWVVVDVSGTMRGGEPGRRKLDFAVEAAAREARRAIDRGDRFGLILVDGRVLGHVPPKEGISQMARIDDTLLEAIDAVDADVTEVDDEQVARIVGRYVRQQDGVDFATRKPPGWDVPGLVQHCARALRGHRQQGSLRAQTAGGAVLRQFCRIRGIRLPYRADPRTGSKAAGLAEALRLLGTRSQAPSSTMVITDFDGVYNTEGLASAAQLVRARGHRLAFVVPDGSSFADAPSSALERDLLRVYTRAEQHRLRRMHEVFGRIGVPMLVATGAQPPERVLDRAQLLQARAA